MFTCSCLVYVYVIHQLAGVGCGSGVNSAINRYHSLADPLYMYNVCGQHNSLIVADMFSLSLSLSLTLICDRDLQSLSQNLVNAHFSYEHRLGCK